MKAFAVSSMLFLEHHPVDVHSLSGSSVCSSSGSPGVRWARRGQVRWRGGGSGARDVRGTNGGTIEAELLVVLPVSIEAHGVIVPLGESDGNRRESIYFFDEFAI